jgi:hypothetical protein
MGIELVHRRANALNMVLTFIYLLGGLKCTSKKMKIA